MSGSHKKIRKKSLIEYFGPKEEINISAASLKVVSLAWELRIFKNSGDEKNIGACLNISIIVIVSRLNW